MRTYSEYHICFNPKFPTSTFQTPKPDIQVTINPLNVSNDMYSFYNFYFPGPFSTTTITTPRKCFILLSDHNGGSPVDYFILVQYNVMIISLIGCSCCTLYMVMTNRPTFRTLFSYFCPSLQI